VKLIGGMAQAFGLMSAFVGTGKLLSTLAETMKRSLWQGLKQVYSVVNNVMNMMPKSAKAPQDESKQEDYPNDTEIAYRIYGEGEIYYTTDKIPEWYADAYDYSKFTNTSHRL
jgi:hypothetical protein